MASNFSFDTSIWLSDGTPPEPQVIDQRHLPFSYLTFTLKTVEDAAYAIREMVVRGAPLIGVTAAYGMYLALRENRDTHPGPALQEAMELLHATRPTAINLFTATQRMVSAFNQIPAGKDPVEYLLAEANSIREEEMEACRMIGLNGMTLIERISQSKNGAPVNILTHCNAGWLACVKWGTATAPVYMAHQKGIPLHVWVDETRPRNQGARLTAFELGLAGVPHTIIPDNTGGHLMQQGMVDMVIVGSDRTTRNGDVANKIGTYLKALAAADNQVPFYVALPLSTFDMSLEDGVRNIPVEERDHREVSCIDGWDGEKITTVRLVPEGSKVANYGFDVTPARLVTALITEKGICRPDPASISRLLKGW